jgi:2-oxoisovalerate dehydrogenase E1 component
LSPTIIRRLGRVVPANLQINARWDAIRKARAAAKKKDGKHAASPSAMIAWAVVKAMEKHAPFAGSYWMTIGSWKTTSSISVLQVALGE